MASHEDVWHLLLSLVGGAAVPALHGDRMYVVVVLNLVWVSPASHHCRGSPQCLKYER